MQRAHKVLGETFADCQVGTTANVPEIMAVAREWAGDLGWRATKEVNQPSRVLFRVTRHGADVFYPRVEVVASDEGPGQSRVTFSASVAVSMWPGNIEADLGRVAATFANGVCHELASREYEIAPASLGEKYQNRVLLRRLQKGQRVVLALVLIAFVLVNAAAILGYRWLNSGAFFAMWLWAATLCMALVVLRWRIVGMRSRTGPYGVLFLALCTAAITLAVVRV
jgi:hypothetical protein